MTAASHAVTAVDRWFVTCDQRKFGGGVGTTPTGTAAARDGDPAVNIDSQAFDRAAY